MKFLFKITKNKVTTLLRGVDFIHNYDTITFIESGEKISFDDLNKILNGTVYTQDEKECKEIQSKLREG